jgi:hypothetical protein
MRQRFHGSSSITVKNASNLVSDNDYNEMTCVARVYGMPAYWPKETFLDDRNDQMCQSRMPRLRSQGGIATVGHFCRYVSLIYTVALETNAFDPSYPTNIVPLSDLSISIRVLEPLRP